MTTLRAELLDELLAEYERPEDLLGEEGLFRQLKKALLERALGAELSEHLGYEKGGPRQPQRLFGEDGSERGRRAGVGGAARPQRQL
jgi:transposase-like protein